VQVDGRWTSLTIECAAGYHVNRATFANTTNFTAAWPLYRNRAALRKVLLDSISGKSMASALPVPEPNETNETMNDRESEATMAQHYKEALTTMSDDDAISVNKAMSAFEYLEDNQAGPYRGRLVPLYRHAPALRALKFFTAAQCLAMCCFEPRQAPEEFWYHSVPEAVPEEEHKL
jgi:hypothetical protein